MHPKLISVYRLRNPQWIFNERSEQENYVCYTIRVPLTCRVHNNYAKQSCVKCGKRAAPYVRGKRPRARSDATYYEKSDKNPKEAPHGGASTVGNS